MSHDLDTLTRQHTAARSFADLLDGDAGSGPSGWIPTLRCAVLAAAYDTAQAARGSSKRCGRLGKASRDADACAQRIAQLQA